MKLTNQQLQTVQLALEGQYNKLMTEVRDSRARFRRCLISTIRDAADMWTLHQQIQKHLLGDSPSILDEEAAE